MDTQWIWMIDLKFCTHSSNKLLHKSVPTVFLIELFSFCGNILTNFEITFWKKTDKNRLSKNYLKRRKTRPRFFWVLVICISGRKTIENHKCVGAGARIVENLVRFLFNFYPYFPNIRRAQERCKIYIESIGIYCKDIKSIQSMEVTTLESNALPFHFSWMIPWDLIIQFRSMIQSNDKSIWS